MTAFLTEERLARSTARAIASLPRPLGIVHAHGVQAGDEKAVRFFFAVNDARLAGQLAAALRDQGLDAKAQADPNRFLAWNATWLDQAGWIVSGTTPPLPMREPDLLAWTHDMIREGERHDAEFKGWHWQAPDFLAHNDDFCLQVRPADGALQLTLYRWNAASEAALAEHDVHWLTPGAGIGSLSVLQRHAHKIRGLMSPSDALPLTDIGVLHALEQIYLPSARETHGDYRQLPRLKRFSCLDAETLKPQALDNPSLRDVLLRRPRKLKTLAALPGWQGLEALALHGAPLASLQGLEACTSLRQLRLVNCRSLAEVSALAALPSLEVLEVYRAPKLADLRPLAGLSGLRWVFIDGTAGSMDSFGIAAHWPQLQAATLLLPAERVDLEALGRHAGAAELVLYTQPGFALPAQETLRDLLERHGRRVRSLMLRPEDQCPSLQVTFDAPYWRLPALPDGHHRTVVS